MKIKLVVILISTVVFCRGQQSPLPSMQALPHSDHGSESKSKEAPHGGIVVDAGKRHIEIVFDPFAGEQKLSAWVMNSSYKPRHPKNGSATATLNYKNGTRVEKKMVRLEDRFYTDVDDLKQAFNAVIIITEDNRQYTATYLYKGLGQ